MKTITETVTAWLPAHNDPAELNSTGPRAIAAMAFFANDMTGAGWTKVGEADITVRLVNKDVLIQKQVESLKKQRDRVLAQAQQMCNQINDKISKLSALTFEDATAP